jgi:cell division septation protein DedD
MERKAEARSPVAGDVRRMYIGPGDEKRKRYRRKPELAFLAKHA